jgi:hypothetical protein
MPVAPIILVHGVYTYLLISKMLVGYSKQYYFASNDSFQPLFPSNNSYYFNYLSAVRLSPLGTATTTGLLYQPHMIDDDECGPIGGMKIGKGNRSTRRKPAPAPLCTPQIPHDQTRATGVGRQRLTA